MTLQCLAIVIEIGGEIVQIPIVCVFGLLHCRPWHLPKIPLALHSRLGTNYLSVTKTCGIFFPVLKSDGIVSATWNFQVNKVDSLWQCLPLQITNRYSAEGLKSWTLFVCLCRPLSVVGYFCASRLLPAPLYPGLNRICTLLLNHWLLQSEQIPLRQCRGNQTWPTFGPYSLNMLLLQMWMFNVLIICY